MKKISAFLFLSVLLVTTSAYALQYKILAVVNGQSISTVQVRERVGLVMSSSGMKQTAEGRNKVTKEIVEILINEALQAQEAKQNNISVSDEEMKKVIADLESKNKLKPGGLEGFVKSKGQSYKAVVDQLRATMLWQKFLARYIRPNIKVTPEDIAKAAAKPKPKKLEVIKRVNISEIIVPIEFGKEAEAKDLAETIVRTANAGGRKYEELAAKYSVGKTAKTGGRLGWIPEKGVVEPLGSSIRNTGAGKVSNPIKVDSMYVIIKVNERQVIDPNEQIKERPAEETALIEKIEAEAKKYVKGLREKAYIETKYTPANLNQMVWGE